MSTLPFAIQRGIRADQPAATTVSAGTLYCVTDEGHIIERSNQTVWQSYSPSSTQTGTVVQVVNTQTGAVATGTTQIPIDDTIPQKTEGDEYMTLAVTPTDAANKLKIDVVIYLSNATNARSLTAALFQDTTADALACGTAHEDTGTAMVGIVFSHYMTAGTTSATTFKVRAGANNTGTTTFNGAGGSRFYGGVFASGITITEIVP